MTTKRKFWLSIGALALTLVVAGTSIGVTLAALQAKLNSSFSISYTAKNVSAAIYGAYGSGSNFTKMTSGSENNILFTETEQTTSKHFDPLDSLEVTEDNPTVTLRYRLFNFKEDELPVQITLSGSNKNMTASYNIKVFDGTQTKNSSGALTEPISTTVPYSTYASLSSLAAAYPTAAASALANSTTALANEDIIEQMSILAVSKGFQAAVDAAVEKIQNGEIDVSENDGKLQLICALSNSLVVLYYNKMLSGASKEELQAFLLDLVQNTNVDDLNLEDPNTTWTNLIGLAFMGGVFGRSIIPIKGGIFALEFAEYVNANKMALENFSSYTINNSYTDFLNAFGYDPAIIYMVPAEILLWNVYDKYLTEGADAAIAMANEIELCMESISDNMDEISSIYKAKFLALPQQLEEFKASGNTAQVQTLKEQCLQTIKECEIFSAYEQSCELAQTIIQKAQANLPANDDDVVASGEVPYAEISIIFTFANKAENAAFTNGKLNFVLGN